MLVSVGVNVNVGGRGVEVSVGVGVSVSIGDCPKAVLAEINAINTILAGISKYFAMVFIRISVVYQIPADNTGIKTGIYESL